MDVLKDRGHISISEGRIVMHDLIQEMGHEIVHCFVDNVSMILENAVDYGSMRKFIKFYEITRYILISLKSHLITHSSNSMHIYF